MTCCFACAKQGHPAAVNAVVDQLRPRLTKMSRYYDRRTGEDADDLLQEAWCGVLDGLHELNLHVGCPEQYLVKRARWRLLDAVKRARVRRCLSLDDLEVAGALPDRGEYAGVEPVVEFAARLKPSQRAVLGCLLVGLTWRETGDRLGCTSANVAYHVRQIRRRYEEWTADS